MKKIMAFLIGTSLVFVPGASVLFMSGSNIGIDMLSQGLSWWVGSLVAGAFAAKAAGHIKTNPFKKGNFSNRYVLHENILGRFIIYLIIYLILVIGLYFAFDHYTKLYFTSSIAYFLKITIYPAFIFITAYLGFKKIILRR